MHPVTIRNVTIGTGRPKICVPIAERTTEEIIKAATALTALPADLAEWRVDWFYGAPDTPQVLETAAALRHILGEMPLLFTFRTAREGGEKDPDLSQYEALNIAAARSGFVDLIDVEMRTGDEAVSRMISAAHDYGVKVVGSSHDFEKTPPREEMVDRLCHMQQMGADLSKIAVMPRSARDVLTLLSATLEMTEHHNDSPVITMAMAGTGVISRLAGECFGSALTFGAAARQSAPGQIGVEALAQILDIIHNNL